MTEVMICAGDRVSTVKAFPGDVLCVVMATYGNKTEEYHVKVNENGKIIFRNEVSYPLPTGITKGKHPIVDSSPG